MLDAEQDHESWLESSLQTFFCEESERRVSLERETRIDKALALFLMD